MSLQNQPEPDALDDLDTDTIEDLDTDDGANDVAGGGPNAWTAMCNVN